MSEIKKNIYKKLQEVRVSLQKTEIKKSGKNSFAKFEYFELSDFLPHINSLMLEVGITSIYTLNTDKALLKLINIDDVNDSIEFCIPTAALEIKGANGIQNIGGISTYTRRYLYMIAFEIASDDEFDADSNGVPRIDDIKIKALKKMVAETDTDIKELLSYVGIKKIEEMTEEQFTRVSIVLQKKQEKNKKEKPLEIIGKIDRLEGVKNK